MLTLSLVKSTRWLAVMTLALVLSTIVLALATALKH